VCRQCQEEIAEAEAVLSKWKENGAESEACKWD
jgi:hypothetical protein